MGYFLIYRPLMQGKLLSGKGRTKLVLASVLGCVVTLQLGALSVVVETSLSGITALPFGAFAALMQPIHLAIGLVEGGITAAVLLFVYQTRPELLQCASASGAEKPLLAQSRAGDPGCRGAGHRRRPVAAGKRQPRRAGMVAVRQ